MIKREKWSEIKD